MAAGDIMSTASGSGLTVFSPAQMTFYKRNYLSFLRKNLWINKFTDKTDIPKQSGQTVSWARITAPVAQTSALTEGTAPSSITLAGTTYTATVLTYGAYVKISDLLEWTGRGSSMERYSEMMGYNAALTKESLAYTELNSNATAFYCGGSSASTFDGSCVLTGVEIRKLMKSFQAKAVLPFEDGLYALIVHPDCMFDLMNDDKVGGWLQAHQFEDPEALWKGTAGAFFKFRLLPSQVVSTETVNSQTAYDNIALGQGALGSVEISGANTALYAVPPSNINISNPLGQVGSVGWKSFAAWKYLGDDGPRAYKVLAVSSSPTA